ncbi:MAG: type II secretion system F family protein [Alphaproteobacteria bacterium]|nr:type II secretion system F family protein [Alphaproteobacteria bacterium]
MPEFSQEVIQIAVIGVIGLAVGIVLLVLLLPYVNGEVEQKKRVNAVAGKSSESLARKLLGTEVGGESKDNRRKQVQDTLSQIEKEAKSKKKRLTLRTLLMQAGLSLTVKMFWVFSLIFGLVVFAGVFWGANQSPLMAGAAGFSGALGVPRWLVMFLRKKRQDKFLNEFANAIDVMVRGIKAGLPVNDTLHIIATEAADPVAPEFAEVVEGQRIGITIDQGIERMYERVPLQEVNFLGIVLAIQSKTGGNLSEALGNLSNVLRDRKKMKAKIVSVSQEAKSSAAIIGALPFCIMLALYVLRPEYISILFTDPMGQMMLTGCAVWMALGILVMKKMINFNI